MWRIQSGSHSSTAYRRGNSEVAVTRIPAEVAAWDSRILGEQGATFGHTFETRRTYDYFCTSHKALGMVGHIAVGEPGGPAEGACRSVVTYLQVDNRQPEDGALRGVLQLSDSLPLVL